MFKIGDVVRVKEATVSTLCKIVNMGADENGTIWYEVAPIEFNSITREFTADKLEKVY